MNCSPSIAIALLLISLTAGMILLYKAKKESLGILYKLVAWFIIIVSFGCMICCTMHCIRKCCKKNDGCGNPQQCEMNMQECTHGGMHGGKCCMMKGHGSCEGKEGACSHGGKSCCMGMEGTSHCQDHEMMDADTSAIK